MNEPIFYSILADDWHKLDYVIRRHYFLKPFSEDDISVRGVMSEVHHSLLAKLFLPFGMIFGALVPYRGQNVPIDVHYRCNPDNGNLYWDRVFRFPGRPDFHFKSHMEQIGDNEVIEYIRFGVGMRLQVSVEDGALVFRDKGYVWRLFGKKFPIPLGLILGSAYVEERALDDNSFSMNMALTHPWFGVMFRYGGRFQLPESYASEGPL